MITTPLQWPDCLAPTGDHPPALDIARAEGCYLYDHSGKSYLDLISGISVSNLGHRHRAIEKAIHQQLERHSFVMVYGEFTQRPQTCFAHLLTGQLPERLNSIYLMSSGSEAVDGALKLARRATGRRKLVAFHKAYHGSTYGAMSVMGHKARKKGYGPFLPGVRHITLNDTEGLDAITKETAAVILAPVQVEAGLRIAEADYLQALRKKCNDTGALLLFDECQTGFGRTGALFAFQRLGVAPDILILGKAMGGGLPLSGFVASRKLMQAFTHDPPLGHLTTFGGHPVCCAAAEAHLRVLLNEPHIGAVQGKARLLAGKLRHPAIQAVSYYGLLMGIELADEQFAETVIVQGRQHGVILHHFLFAPHMLRLIPPLIITEAQIEAAAQAICQSIEDVHRQK